MTLKEAYLEKKNLLTPAQEFVTFLASATCRKETTVLQWLSGVQVPNETVQNKLSEVLGIPREELFADILPKEESKTNNNQK